MKHFASSGGRFSHRPRERLSRFWAALLAMIASCAFAAMAYADAPAKVDGYKLAPGDRITLTVIGQTELSGDFTVDGAGNIVLPLVGALQVANLSISECQQRIVGRLSDGILVNPSVFVRASELRPIQVLGDVRTPGSYVFRYGTMVKSAIAQAGGLGTADRVTATSDLLLADERVRTLGATQRALLIRQARLKAQLEGAKTFTPPGTLADDDDTAKIIAEESETLKTESESFDKQLNLLQSQKPQLLAEDEALGGQIASGEKQLELIQSQLNEYNKVTEKGFGNSRSVLELKIAVENKQSDIWRLGAERSRLRVNIMELEGRLVDSETARKKQILTELQDVRQRLHEIDVTLPSAREVRASMLRQSGGMVGAAEIRNMKVTRLRNGEISSFPVSETTLLEPGDILEIRAQRPGDRQAFIPPLTNALPKPDKSDGISRE